uniref:Uncharacterized protein n=1 Tax=Anopheles atroparvus TaxID=41427 RepID=A0A182JF29_ANOAO
MSSSPDSDEDRKMDFNPLLLASGKRKSAFLPYKPSNTVLTNLQRGNTEANIPSEICLNFHEKTGQAGAGGHNEIVRLLLENGASINHMDIVGNTALMYAAAGNHPHTCNELLNGEASFTDTNEDGESAYSLAVKNNAHLAQAVLENHITALLMT